MPEQKLQLTVSKTSSQEYELLFKRGGKKMTVNDCTKSELVMIKKVIEKVIL